MHKQAKGGRVMLREERHRRILDTLRHDGKVAATELSAALDVSEDTMRRDLRELSEAGLLQRVHGGALPLTPATMGYVERQHHASEAKAAIAIAAARLVRDGQVVILDGGTTTLQVARQLAPNLRATVVTTSPPIAVALSGHPGIEIVVIGGRLYKESLATVGAATVEALSMVRADICMVGVCSLHPEVGISVLDPEEAHVKRAMIAGAAEVVAVADGEKLGTAAPYVVAPLTALTRLVTEASVPDEVLAPYRAQGIIVLRG